MIMRYSFNWNDYKPRNDRGYKGRWSQGGTMQISSYFFSHPYGLILNKRNKWVTNQWWEKVNVSTLPLQTSQVSSWYQMFFFRRTHLRSWITVPIPSEITRVWWCLVSWSSHWEASLLHIWWHYSPLMYHCHNRKSKISIQVIKMQNWGERRKPKQMGD